MKDTKTIFGRIPADKFITLGALVVLFVVFSISANNFFGVSWSPDAQSYAAQIVRRNLGVSEVLLYTLGANAPLFLTQEEIGQFEWGR